MQFQQTFTLAPSGTGRGWLQLDTPRLPHRARWVVRSWWRASFLPSRSTRQHCQVELVSREADDGDVDTFSVVREYDE
jgi:hypothetical protein